MWKWFSRSTGWTWTVPVIMSYSSIQSQKPCTAMLPNCRSGSEEEGQRFLLGQRRRARDFCWVSNSTPRSLSLDVSIQIAAHRWIFCRSENTDFQWPCGCASRTMYIRTRLYFQLKFHHGDTHEDLIGYKVCSPYTYLAVRFVLM